MAAAGQDRRGMRFEVLRRPLPAAWLRGMPSPPGHTARLPDASIPRLRDWLWPNAPRTRLRGQTRRRRRRQLLALATPARLWRPAGRHDPLLREPRIAASTSAGLAR